MKFFNILLNSLELVFPKCFADWDVLCLNCQMNSPTFASLTLSSLPRDKARV